MEWNKRLQGAIAITGCSTFGIGNAGGLNDIELTAHAVQLAVKDAGLRMQDIDGLMSANLSSSMWVIKLAEYLGIQPDLLDSTQIGGASFVGHLLIAALAIEAGVCKNIVISYGAAPRGGGGVSATSGARKAMDPFPYEDPYQLFNPPSSYAFATQRHMYEFGTTREQLAEVAVAARAWARLNPEAFIRDPLSIDDVINARVISTPLTIRDCCLVTDGAAAVVVQAADRADSSPHRPVYVMGTAMATSHRQIACMPSLTTTSAAITGAQALTRAGIGLSEIDVVQLYDAFTINPILFLEDLGFCKKGEGGDFVMNGRIGPQGELPVNTNGGGLSCVHPGMYSLFGMVEAVRQLRGGCGDRQVSDAEIALVHGNGGVLSAQATSIFSINRS